MKYFVVSDTHSFARELKTSLKRAGFNKRNKNHTLILCGDIFDRGSETMELYKFFMSIPKKRRILIKGNHEELYLDLLNKDFPDEYDYSNHTVDTFCHIAGYDAEVMSRKYWYKCGAEDVWEHIRSTWYEIRRKVADSPVTAWIKSKEWKDYFELDNYIFVHSFIPLKNDTGLPGYYTQVKDLKYFPEWRTESTDKEWSDSRWGCPWENYRSGLFDEEVKNGKILVCGHWVVTDFRQHLLHDYFSEDTHILRYKNLIAMDCGVWHYRYTSNYYHPQNVLVIDEDGKCYDERGVELKEENENETNM